MKKLYGWIFVFFVLGTQFGLVIGSEMAERRDAERREVLNELFVSVSTHHVQCVEALQTLGGGKAWKKPGAISP